MKVLLVSASPRRKGNTYTALCEVAKTLEQDGIEAEVVEIGTKPVRGCIACNWCKQHADEHRCAFEDDMVNEISAKAEKADAFVFGAPVYYGQPNGSALSLIQRLLYSNGAAFVYKPVANVCVCRRGGADTAYQTLNMMFEMMNMPIVTSQYWNIAYGREPGQTAQDIEGMQTMRTLAHNLSWILKKFHGVPTGERPDKEAAWTPMNFIR
ncbi:MAG TPA: flavodoxin family protein [Prevotella sp.]|nr:flavodoxin family protein [Prevotella sp.]